MNLVKHYLTKSNRYNYPIKFKPKGIIMHSLGVSQPRAEVIFGNMNIPGEESVHALLELGRILQTLPFNYKCGGCGEGSKGSGNDTHIQFEICEPSGFSYIPNSATMKGYDVKKQEAYFRQIFKEAVEFCVYLCRKYKWTEKAIICHSEAHDLGIASSHADVMHWFPKHGESMDTFRAAVKKVLNTRETTRKIRIFAKPNILSKVVGHYNSNTIIVVLKEGIYFSKTNKGYVRKKFLKI